MLRDSLKGVLGRALPTWVRAAVVALVLAGCWGLMVAVGGSYFVVVHVFYVPILLAALWFDVAVTLVVAIVAGSLAGPLLPRELVPQAYARDAWMVRLAFFLAIGGLSAWADRALRERTTRLRSMYSSLTRLYTHTLRGFALALEMKDEETSAHCERVATNARLVGVRLGLRESDREALYWAGYLHDVGKLSTPSDILVKPGALTPKEYDLVKLHTVKGEELLLSVSSSFGPLAQGVRHHHERWDGRGYPDGLAGKRIPLSGRILAVVDVFEALTSKRPYRDAWSEGDAITYLEEGIGSQFDPDVVAVFLELEQDDLIHVEGRHGHHTRERPTVFDPAILASSTSDSLWR